MHALAMVHVVKSKYLVPFKTCSVMTTQEPLWGGHSNMNRLKILLQLKFVHFSCCYSCLLLSLLLTNCTAAMMHWCTNSCTMHGCTDTLLLHRYLLLWSDAIYTCSLTFLRNYRQSSLHHCIGASMQQCISATVTTTVHHHINLCISASLSSASLHQYINTSVHQCINASKQSASVHQCNNALTSMHQCNSTTEQSFCLSMIKHKLPFISTNIATT